jgi:hypothetical protein
MSHWQATHDHTTAIAINLTNNSARMPANALRADLIANDLRTVKGEPFKPHGRGIYSHIRSVYHEHEKHGRTAEADAVATAFTKPDGSYAYE